MTRTEVSWKRSGGHDEQYREKSGFLCKGKDEERGRKGKREEIDGGGSAKGSKEIERRERT